MSDDFNQESKDALISYRISHAYESLNEAKLMYSGDFFNAAINRLYYACYYAAFAIAFEK